MYVCMYWQYTSTTPKGNDDSAHIEQWFRLFSTTSDVLYVRHIYYKLVYTTSQMC